MLINQPSLANKKTATKNGKPIVKDGGTLLHSEGANSPLTVKSNSATNPKNVPRQTVTTAETPRNRIADKAFGKLVENVSTTKKKDETGNGRTAEPRKRGLAKPKKNREPTDWMHNLLSVIPLLKK